MCSVVACVCICVYISVCMRTCVCADVGYCIDYHLQTFICLAVFVYACDQDDKCVHTKFVSVCKSPCVYRTALLLDACPVYQHHCSRSLSRVEFTAIAATAKVNLGQVRAYAIQMWRVCTEEVG